MQTLITFILNTLRQSFVEPSKNVNKKKTIIYAIIPVSDDVLFTPALLIRI